MTFKEVIAPYIIKRRLISEIKATCSTCNLTIEKLQLVLLPPSAAKIAGIRFRAGTRKTTEVFVEVGKITVPFNLSSFFSSRLLFGEVKVEKLKVDILEGDDEIPSTTDRAPSSNGLNIHVDDIHVQNASFTYTREHLKKKGILRISNIEAKSGPVEFDGSPETMVSSWATGVLEESGEFRLEVDVKLFSKPLQVNVKLEISNQNLAGLNTFFVPNDGVRLKGNLLKGRSTVKMQGRKLSSFVYALYRDLNIKIESNEERSGISAFFQNLIASLATGEQNTVGKDLDRTGEVEVERKQKQSIVSFILTGMKEGAMKVSAQGKPAHK